MTRSRRATAAAPMRIGLAGGGSDTLDHPAADGGAVVSAAVGLWCRATLTFEAGPDRLMVRDRTMPLHANATALRRAAHAHMIEVYDLPPGDYGLETASDMPPGCGLGSSSSLVVAIVSAYAKAFDLRIGRLETAHVAWRIERRRLGWPGGMQDQLAAAFGGLHLFRFGPGARVGIDRCDDLELVARLQASLCLFTLGVFKTGLVASHAAGSPTTALRDDALRLWADMSRGGFGTLTDILAASHRMKCGGIAADTLSILDQLAAVEQVKAIKLCGAGPAGAFLVHHRGDFEALTSAARARGVAGRFMPLAIVAATDTG